MQRGKLCALRWSAAIVTGGYLLVVSMGHTPDGWRRDPQQKTVKPPVEQKMQYTGDCKP